MNASYSFDYAADSYDTTRAYPPNIAGKITRSILDLTGATPATRIFELSIGTGRISAPLIARGLNVTGFDLSHEMMEKLRAKFSSEMPLGLVRGDAIGLPFPTGTFDVALAVYVFHLIAQWRQAIVELRRVLQPGGLILHSTHARDPRSANVIVRDRWHELVEARGERWRRPGAPNRKAVPTEFQRLGAGVEEVEVTRAFNKTIPRQEIAGFANRINSDTWAVSDETLRATVTELTEWTHAHFGSLDVPVSEEHVFGWQVIRFDCAPLLPEPIRQALTQLIPILNATGAPWVLSGSCCLALHGVKVEPHDLDIITDQDGAYCIGAALQEAAKERQPVRWGEGERIRSHRGLYQFRGVQVDVVGAGELREDDHQWIPPRPPSEWDTLDMPVPGTNLTVKVLTLKYEREAYRRLQREEQVKLIEERLAQ